MNNVHAVRPYCPPVSVSSFRNLAVTLDKCRIRARYTQFEYNLLTLSYFLSECFVNIVDKY